MSGSVRRRYERQLDAVCDLPAPFCEVPPLFLLSTPDGNAIASLVLSVYHAFFSRNSGFTPLQRNNLRKHSPLHDEEECLRCPKNPNNSQQTLQSRVRSSAREDGLGKTGKSKQVSIQAKADGKLTKGSTSPVLFTS